MNFRDARLSDLSIIVDIYNSTISSRLVTADTEPVHIDSRINWFNEHTPDRRPLWIVEEAGQVLGWVSFQNFYGRPAYNATAEISIYLAEQARGKGFGKYILEYCFTRCGDLKIQTLLGFIFAHNEPSIRLFLKSGFGEWANLKDIAVMDDQPYSLKIFGKKI